jgi:hypothetical protein
VKIKRGQSRKRLRRLDGRHPLPRNSWTASYRARGNRVTTALVAGAGLDDSGRIVVRWRCRHRRRSSSAAIGAHPAVIK